MTARNLVSLASLIPFLFPCAAAASTLAIEKVSGGPLNVDADAAAGLATVSADGRFVAFNSAASNLVPGDTNGVEDIFLFDRALNVITRVSQPIQGTQGPFDYSFCPMITPDGRYISFLSYDSDLVANDGPDASVFVYDRVAGTNTLVSLTDADGAPDNGCFLPSISDDGRYVAFLTAATNMGATIATDPTVDLFVRDRQLGTTTQLDFAVGGGSPNANCDVPVISGDGRYVVFTSIASDLVAIDTNAKTDVFRVDVQTHAIDLVSINMAGNNGGNLNSRSDGMQISSFDGRFVVFSSFASNVSAFDTNQKADVFVRDMQAGTTTKVSVGFGGPNVNGDSGWPVISRDARYVAFHSAAGNVVTGDQNGAFDVFLRDRTAATTERLSVSTTGVEGDADSFSPSISAGGRFVAFYSESVNLVPGDGNGLGDQFLVSRCWVEFKTIGLGKPGSFGITPHFTTKDGSCAAGDWQLGAADLAPGASGVLFAGAQFLDQFPVLGGHFYVDLGAPFVTFFVTASGAGAIPLPSTDVAALAGATLYLQLLASDAGAFGGVSMTPALSMKIGF